MGKKHYSFDKIYPLNSFIIKIKGEVTQTDFGRYIAKIEYTHPRDRTTRKATIFLGGDSKIKLERRLISFLHNELHCQN